MRINMKSEVAAGVVAASAFVASAQHIITVVNETNPWFIALVYPVGIDGLIFVGIRAIQAGRKVWGILSLIVGAAFSLAFNAHAEHALTMPRAMIAASMPLCMFVAFLIEATAPKHEEPEATPTATEWERLEERVEARRILAHEQAMAAIREEAMKLIEERVSVAPAPEPVRVQASVGPRSRPVPQQRTEIESKPTGRIASWDVEKAVRMILDGRTDEDVLATVDGLGPKPLQRTKRAVRLIQGSSEVTDASVASTVGQAETHIARVRAAMINKEDE